MFFHRQGAPHLGKNMTVAGYELIYGGFRLANGAYALAYWKPLDLMTMEYEGAVTIETTLSGAIHLVDPMDGSVYTIPHKRDPFASTILQYLPVRDYPLYLVFGELAVERKKEGEETR